MNEKKVYKAIAEVTAKLAKEGISKARNNVQQGYKFRGIDDVYNALAPFLAESKLCILPNVLSREVVERQSAKGGALFYITVKVDFAFVSAEDGSDHHVVTYGEAMDSGDKATNKAMSAAYKYAAMQAFCIPTEGDNDADSTTHEVRAETDAVKKPHQSVAKDAWDTMKPAVQNQLADIATLVIDLLTEGHDQKAFEHYEEKKATLDADQQVALWSRFDSKQRSTLKKLADAWKEAEAKRKAA